MSERVLDSSDGLDGLLLVVAQRLLRSPLLALDLANEVIASLADGEDNGVEALRLLRRTLAASLDADRIASVERRRRGWTEPITVSAAGKQAIRETGAARIDLGDDVMRALRELERTAPNPVRLSRLQGSGLLLTAAPEGDRRGA